MRIQSFLSGSAVLMPAPLFAPRLRRPGLEKVELCNRLARMKVKSAQMISGPSDSRTRESSARGFQGMTPGGSSGTACLTCLADHRGSSGTACLTYLATWLGFPLQSAFSPEGARHISPGQVRRRQPPNVALGGETRSGGALKGRKNRECLASARQSWSIDPSFSTRVAW